MNRFPFPDDSPVPAAEAIFDRTAVEIARGCTEGCRFCQAGMIYRPVRERDPKAIVDTVVSAVEKGGYDEASLTSLSTADYSCVAPLIKEVMKELVPRRVSLGISSLRAYGLPEEVLDDISQGEGDRPHLRPRGRLAADARRPSTRTSASRTSTRPAGGSSRAAGTGPSSIS